MGVYFQVKCRYCGATYRAPSKPNPITHERAVADLAYYKDIREWFNAHGAVDNYKDAHQKRAFDVVTGLATGEDVYDRAVQLWQELQQLQATARTHDHNLKELGVALTWEE